MRDLRAELAPLLDQEPRSSLALLNALREPSPLRVRVLTAGPVDRSRCVLVREAVGSWTAYPVLTSVADAEELARAIDRSPATQVEGDADLVAELVPHIRRAGPSRVSEKISVPYQTVEDFPEPDESTRMATYFDLPQLVEIFAGFELRLGARTVGAVRRTLADAVKRMWVVVSVDTDDETRVRGAMTMGGFTPKYGFWEHMSVPPGSRGQGRSWAMAIRAVNIHRGTGLGFIGVLADTNPMKTPPIGPDAIEHIERIEDHFMSLALQMPDRVPGERKLRRAISAADAKLRRSRPQRARTFSREQAGLDRLGQKL